MAKSLVTPSDLRQFATILQKNIDDFNAMERDMNVKLNSYDWNDAVAVRFKNNFEATKPPLNELRHKMSEFIPYLNQKAIELEDYLKNAGG